MTYNNLGMGSGNPDNLRSSSLGISFTGMFGPSSAKIGFFMNIYLGFLPVLIKYNDTEFESGSDARLYDAESILGIGILFPISDNVSLLPGGGLHSAIVSSFTEAGESFSYMGISFGPGIHCAVNFHFSEKTGIFFAAKIAYDPVGYYTVNDTNSNTNVTEGAGNIFFTGIAGISFRL